MMSPERAVEIIENLVDGIHPLTGEILPESNICEETGIVDALNCAIRVLNERIVAERAIEEYRRQQTKKVPDKANEAKRNLPENAGKPWLPEADTELLKLYKAKVQYTKRGKLNAGRPWTEEDDRELRKLFKDQVPVEKMCVILQRRPRGINNRLICLGLMQHTTDRYGNQIKPGLERVGTQWLHEEDAQLREMFNEGKPIEEMMKAFHRSEMGIKYRLERLQLIEDAEKYPEETGTSSRFDNEDLRRRFLHGETIAQIAALYGQSEQAIRVRLFYMGFGGSGPRVLPDRKNDT